MSPSGNASTGGNAPTGGRTFNRRFRRAATALRVKQLKKDIKRLENDVKRRQAEIEREARLQPTKTLKPTEAAE